MPRLLQRRVTGSLSTRWISPLAVVALPACSLVFNPSAHQRNLGADATALPDTGADGLDASVDGLDATLGDAPSSDLDAPATPTDSPRPAEDAQGTNPVRVRVLAGGTAVQRHRVFVHDGAGSALFDTMTDMRGEADLDVPLDGTVTLESSFMSRVPLTYYGIPSAARLGLTRVTIVHQLRPEPGAEVMTVVLPRPSSGTLVLTTGCVDLPIIGARTSQEIAVGPACREAHDPPYHAVVVEQGPTGAVIAAWDAYGNAGDTVMPVPVALAQARLSYASTADEVSLERSVRVGGWPLLLPHMALLAGPFALDLEVPHFGPSTFGEDGIVVALGDSFRSSSVTWSGAGRTGLALTAVDLPAEAPGGTATGASVAWDPYPGSHDYIYITRGGWHAVAPSGTTSITRPNLIWPDAGGTARVHFIERSDFDSYVDALSSLGEPTAPGVTTDEAVRIMR